MKSFKQFLLESTLHRDFVEEAPEENKKLGITTNKSHYSNEETGVSTFIHTCDTCGDNKRNIAEWGFVVKDETGKQQDSPIAGVPLEMRQARSRTALGHLEDFAVKNPEIHTIYYQVNAGEQGEKNHQVYRDKWKKTQDRLGITTELVRTSSNVFKS